MVLPKLVTTKKAQSALEFLTTYGWAFLVILVMIGALSYFGVLDPGRFLPNKCLFGAGIGACSDFGITGNSIVLSVTNNLGSAVSISSATASITGISSPLCVPPLPNIAGNVTQGSAMAYSATPTFAAANWNASTTLLMNITGCTINSGEKPTVRITLVYTPVGKTFAQTIEGEVSVKKN